jgi:hypothetical protein
MTVYPSTILKNLGVSLGRKDTTAQHPLGIKVIGNDGNTYQYGKAGAAITVMDALKADTAEGIHDVDPTTATEQVVVGVAYPVAAADNEYFWYCVEGIVVGANVADAATAGAILGSTASAGRLGAVTVTGGGATVNEVEQIAAIAAGKGIQALTDGSASNTGTIRIN